ncbi:YidB family protein [Comamonas terrigena]|uniref:YidB family protein n=1 Tax=Comamonas terrigena TaxID=32013 RepID=UPI002447632D|nr:YidB family protein [Comamonas terrigena]MDH0047696.1 OmpA family protein [Comamonas terrigena]MDH0510116.1 OmpA family protein [Comamonas terrigena]MDH1089506.1 OmpA family protein [Comamonas terrigena]MDH1500773.1 OmpA family protein [Comamonas terrigena]
MLDTLIREVSARLGLGDQARPLIQMLVAYIANPATGGLSGFLDKFRSAGMDGLVQSWLGSATTPQVPSASQLDTVLGTGDGLLNKLATRLGLPYDKVSTAVAALLPMLVSRMTPGGTVPNVLPTEFNDIAREGQSLFGMGQAAARAAATAATASAAAPVAAASGGIGKWLPWLIAALVVILGISYCAKGKPPAEAPAPAAVPAPAAPAPAPAPAPAATPPATDSFTAPEGAGVLEGMLHDMPMLRVFFDSGKTEVAPEFADKAKALVAYLQGNPDAKAVISGFNDPTGDPAKNAELSKHRAEAVQTALVAAGVPIERTALEKPADTTDTGASNAASRRVDVVLRK